MRIVAGTARGRPLFAPRGARTRPTSEKVRAAVFNVLGQFFEGGEVLDLYAGSGALALEALSRGCARATCVDGDRAAAEAIRRNAEACGFGERLTVVAAPVERALPALPAGAFTLVFIDPPYALGPVPALSALPPHLAPGARVVAEHSARAEPPDRVGPLARLDLRRYGDTGISIYGAE